VSLVASFVDSIDSGKSILWRVRSGLEVERSGADSLRLQVKDRLGVDGLVVGHEMSHQYRLHQR